MMAVRGFRDEYAQMLIDQEITGEDLVDLDKQTLEGWGMKTGPAMRLMRALHQK